MNKRLFTMTGLTALVTAGAASAAGAQNTTFPDEPPNYAEPGKCYQRVLVRAEYDRYVDQYLSREAYDRVNVTEPALEARSKDYMSKEAGVRYVVHQPVYDTTTEQVLVQPEYERLIVEPAELKTVTERVLVREPQNVWKRGRLPGAQAYRYDEETGDVWCLIEEPGEYSTVQRQVVVQPETVRAVSVPAKYASIERQVLVEPGGVEEVPIPAEYASYQYQELVQRAGQSRYQVEAQMSSVEKERLVSPQRYEWRVVGCDEIPVLQSPPPRPAPQDDGWNEYQEKDNLPEAGFTEPGRVDVSFNQTSDNRVLTWRGKR